MFQKIKILEIFTSLNLRSFKAKLLSMQISKLVQFHSGGDDYCPLLDCEGLGGSIGNTPANGFVFAWRDDVERKSNPGEKRIYAIKKDTGTGLVAVQGEIYLKNDGTIEVTGGKDLKIVVNGNADIKAQKVNIDATQTNLGVNGKKIVLDGDEVTVDPGTHKGTVKSSAVNTSI